MGNDSEKCCRENQNTYFTINYLLPKFVPFKGNRGEIAVQPERPQMKIKYGECPLPAAYLTLHRKLN